MIAASRTRNNSTSWPCVIVSLSLMVLNLIKKSSVDSPVSVFRAVWLLKSPRAAWPLFSLPWHPSQPSATPPKISHRSPVCTLAGNL
jgi:hypothetical protein